MTLSQLTAAIETHVAAYGEALTPSLIKAHVRTFDGGDTEADLPTPRLRVRRVSVKGAIGAARGCTDNGRCVGVCLRHGGSVANAYRYPAETEAAAVVAFPEGGSWSVVGRLPANKVTQCGVAGLLGPAAWKAEKRESAGGPSSVPALARIATQQAMRAALAPRVR